MVRLLVRHASSKLSASGFTSARSYCTCTYRYLIEPKLCMLLSRFAPLISMSLKRKAGDVALDSAKKAKPNASITSFFGQPKAAVSSSATNASEPASSQTLQGSEPVSSPIATPISDLKVAPNGTLSAAITPAKFDKEAWVEKLTDEQKELLKLEIGTLDESWLAVLKDEIKSPEFLNLKRFLKTEAEAGKKIFPPSEDVYSWYVLRAPTLNSFPTNKRAGPATPPSTQSKP